MNKKEQRSSIFQFEETLTLYIYFYAGLTKLIILAYFIKTR